MSARGAWLVESSPGRWKLNGAGNESPSAYWLFTARVILMHQPAIPWFDGDPMNIVSAVESVIGWPSCVGGVSRHDHVIEHGRARNRPHLKTEKFGRTFLCDDCERVAMAHTNGDGGCPECSAAKEQSDREFDRWAQLAAIAAGVEK